jgi:autotransporter-associated beta strand protein
MKPRPSFRRILPAARGANPLTKLSCASLALLALTAGSPQAAGATYTWQKGTGTWDWNANANWLPNSAFPNQTDDTANLNSVNQNGGMIVNLNETITVGTLQVGDPSSSNGWMSPTIAAGTAGSLVFDVSSGNAVLTKPTAANTGSDTISANVTLNDNLNITNAAFGPLTISGNIDQDGTSRTVTKLGAGRLVLSGTNNTYDGGTTVSEGALQFNSTGAIAGSGRNVTVSPGATVAAGYAIDNAFLNRLAESSNAFTVALGVNSALALDFSSSTGATLGNATLGAIGAFTYSGTLTPNGTTYRLGGGGGTLTVSSALDDSAVPEARSVLVNYSGGTVILSGANGYSGGTTVTAGKLQFNSAGAIGGSGRNVTVSPGATVAAGYAINNAFLNRLADSNDAFTVALGAASSSDLDFGSSAGATLGNATLGASGTFIYSGTLTPNGTTYRLGGGGGTLTVSSALTDARSLVVDGSSGGGTVVLSGSGNTFNGATTVTNGTLQLNTAGAFNNIARTVTVNSGGTLTFNATDAAKAAAVAVNSGGTATFSAASAANGGTFMIGSGGTASVTASSGISGGTFTINSGGVLKAGTNLAAVAASAYAGGSVHLNGGTVSLDTAALSGTHTVGGSFSVDASSTFNPYGGNNNQVLTLVFGTLDFSGDGYTLTFSNANNYTAKPVTGTSKFVGSTISHSGTLGVNAVKTYVELNNTAIRADKTLTKTGSQAFTVSGSLGVAMLGGAELLGADSFTMITAANTFTNTSTFDTTNGLWSVSGTTSPVTATLANSMGSIADGGSTTFASEDAGHVSLTGLTVSNPYTLTLTLASAGDQATVMTQLAKNPAFSAIAAIGADQISLQFTAPATTGYFAWENVHTTSGDWYLGGNLTGVALGTISTSPYDTWANGTFVPPLTQKLPGDNQDGDSLDNLQEFAFGTQPTVSTGPIVYVSGGSVTPGTPQVFPNVPASGMYSIVFGRRADYVAAGLTYTVQFSAGLDTWVDNNDGTNPPVQVATDGTINAMSVPFVDFILTPSGMQKPTFARVKVELAD